MEHILTKNVCEGLNTTNFHQSLKIIERLIPLWWNCNISKETKKRIRHMKVARRPTYGFQVWILNEDSEEYWPL